MANHTASASPVQSESTAPYAVRIAAHRARSEPIRFEVYRTADGATLSEHEHYDAADAECGRLLLDAGERIDVLASDLDWWGRIERSEWWNDLATETVADSYDDERFELCIPPDWDDEDLDRYEADAVERYLSRHVDARERASRFVSDFDQAHYFGRLAGHYDRP